MLRNTEITHNYTPTLKNNKALFYTALISVCSQGITDHHHHHHHSIVFGVFFLYLCIARRRCGKLSLNLLRRQSQVSLLSTSSSGLDVEFDVQVFLEWVVSVRVKCQEAEANTDRLMAVVPRHADDCRVPCRAVQTWPLPPQASV